LLKIYLSAEGDLNRKILVIVNRLIKVWWQHHPIRSAMLYAVQAVRMQILIFKARDPSEAAVNTGMTSSSSLLKHYAI
jgi:hypothetical protein